MNKPAPIEFSSILCRKHVVLFSRIACPHSRLFIFIYSHRTSARMVVIFSLLFLVMGSKLWVFWDEFKRPMSLVRHRGMFLPRSRVDRDPFPQSRSIFRSWFSGRTGWNEWETRPVQFALRFLFLFIRAHLGKVATLIMEAFAQTRGG